MPIRQWQRQVNAGTVKPYNRHEMVELIVVDGRARGIIARNMVNGQLEVHLADAVVLASGGHVTFSFIN